MFFRSLATLRLKKEYVGAPSVMLVWSLGINCDGPVGEPIGDCGRAESVVLELVGKELRILLLLQRIGTLAVAGVAGPKLGIEVPSFGLKKIGRLSH